MKLERRDDLEKDAVSAPVIYFVRHGQTDWNAQRRYQGQIDIPLNDTGRRQARGNGLALAKVLGWAPDVQFVCSPLSRARETMEIIRHALGLDPAGYQTDDRLREINYGEWQGRLQSEVNAERPEEVAARRADPWNWQAPGPGGESNAQLSRRVLHWLREVDRDTVVVAHGGVMRCLRGYALGLPEHEIPHLDVPQDKVMVINGDGLEWLSHAGDLEHASRQVE